MRLTLDPAVLADHRVAEEVLREGLAITASQKIRALSRAERRVTTRARRYAGRVGSLERREFWTRVAQETQVLVRHRAAALAKAAWE